MITAQRYAHRRRSLAAPKLLVRPLPAYSAERGSILVLLARKPEPLDDTARIVRSVTDDIDIDMLFSYTKAPGACRGWRQMTVAGQLY